MTLIEAQSIGLLSPLPGVVDQFNVPRGFCCGPQGFDELPHLIGLSHVGLVVHAAEPSGDIGIVWPLLHQCKSLIEQIEIGVGHAHALLLFRCSFSLKSKFHSDQSQEVTDLVFEDFVVVDALPVVMPLKMKQGTAKLRCALFHLQRHDYWQGINDDEILKDEVCDLLRLIRMKLALQRKGTAEQQQRMRMTNPNLDLFNQALALVQQWPNDPDVARRLRGMYDQADMAEAYQVGQFVEALWAAAETSGHIELINHTWQGR